MPPARVAIEEPQALWFRARRSHLARGAASPRAAARAILGAQAQQDGPAFHALGLRTARRPTAAALRRLLVERRGLVRTWGQRDTLHLYDPDDWPRVIAALAAWPQSGRRGGRPPTAVLARARRRFRSAREPLLRTDLFDLLPSDYVAELEEHSGVGRSARRLGASRLIWLLAREGEVCFADKVGSELRYAPRRLVFPDLEWPRPPTAEAALALTRRYLATWGPATAADAAHFFGARVGEIKEQLARLADELMEVECGGRRGLVALARDRRALGAPAPAARDWPLRLLPQWDTHLMTHKDKSWVVPRAEERREVWRKAAVVAPTVIAGGRVVATWSQRATRTRVTVTVTPLSGWRASLEREIEREAAALAAHLEVAAAPLVVERGSR